MTEIEKNLRRNIGNKLKLARAKTKYTQEILYKLFIINILNRIKKNTRSNLLPNYIHH